MPTLGSYFPEDIKKEYIRHGCLPGKVLYLFCTFTTPQKEKYLALAFVGSPTIFFIINSHISEYIKRSGLEALQVLLRASDHAFLDHDSYVDCSNPRTDLSYDDIERQLLIDTDRIRGELNEASQGEIIRVVHNAKTISPYHKRLILKGLCLK